MNNKSRIDGDVRMFSEAFFDRVPHQRNSSSADSSRFNSASSPAANVEGLLIFLLIFMGLGWLR